MSSRFASISASLLLIIASSTAHAEITNNRFYGYAYDADSGRYLYTEAHHQRLDGERWLGGTIKYYGADGGLIASKTLDFSADPYIPLFRLEIPGQHYVEAITSVTQKLFTMLRISDGQTRTDEISRVPGMAADSGFHNAIVDHFDQLKSGETFRFRFGVAGMLDTFSFRCRKTGDTAVDGRPAITLRVEPDSLLRFLGGPLTIVYELETKHLLDYRGVSNLHDPATGKAYNVHITYASKPPADAPQSLPPLD